MKIITNDYGCGTSSSILDYENNNAIIVSESNHKHIFDVQDDLLFIGHDFLLYLWNNQQYLNHWKNFKYKKYVWCFEKIDCIVDAWKQKSHYSLNLISQFTNDILCSDEVDARKYNLKWLPQWASRKFFDLKDIQPNQNKITFSGQAGKPGYQTRDILLKELYNDNDLKDKFYISNTDRVFSWENYINNFLNHKFILAPIGNFKGFNTRTYEALTSGRVLIQQIDDDYIWHQESLSKYKNVIFFKTFNDLKDILLNQNIEEFFDNNPLDQFQNNNLHSRINSIK